MPRGEGPVPDRNLALDLVRCTEAAALAAARWVGRGDKNAADGAEGGKAIDIPASIEDNIRNVAKARKLQPQDITVTILDRDRHQEAIERVRKMGARVRLITDGDVAGAITAAKEGTGVDLLYGIGGTPEGVVSAAALKCIGGEIQG